MKKNLLLSLSIGICFSSVAQSGMHAVKQTTINTKNQTEKSTPGFSQSVAKPKINQKSGGGQGYYQN